jgi:hypothetical protein
MGDNLVGDDILTKQYFPRVYMEERKELGTGLISGGYLDVTSTHKPTT